MQVGHEQFAITSATHLASLRSIHSFPGFRLFRHLSLPSFQRSFHRTVLLFIEEDILVVRCSALGMLQKPLGLRDISELLEVLKTEPNVFLGYVYPVFFLKLSIVVI